MVVSRQNVFGTEIHKGDDIRPRDFLDIALIAKGNGMRQSQIDPKQCNP